MKHDLYYIYEIRSKILKAMAHPTRLFIIDKLGEREHCVCELASLVGCDISTISKHLSIMKNAGILGTRKSKNTIYYFLTCSCITKYIECVNGVIKNTFEIHNKILKSTKRGGII